MDWSNILIPAGVAALVTLGIEYAAKPWLDARRERILSQARDRRELVVALTQAKTDSFLLDTVGRDAALPGHASLRSDDVLRLEALRANVESNTTGAMRQARLLYRGFDPLPYRMVVLAARTMQVCLAMPAHVSPEDRNLMVGHGLRLIQSRPFTLRGMLNRRRAGRWLDEYERRGKTTRSGESA